MTIKAPPQSPASPTPHQPPNRPRFQFSVKTLLKVVTVTAIVLAVLMVLPEIFAMSLLFLAAVALPTVFLAGVLYATGELRTFAIGGLVAVIALWTLYLGEISRIAFLTGSRGIGISLILLVIIACLNGWLCVAARRWIERNQAD